MRGNVCSFLLALAMLAGPASAAAPKSEAGKTGVALEAGPSFADQREAIEKALADGKTYSEISATDREEVRSALSRMAMHLDGGRSVQDLPEATKAIVFNDQERINQILTQASEDSRVVCTRQTKVGTHRPVTQCLTVAERRRIREQTADELYRHQRPAQLKSN